MGKMVPELNDPSIREEILQNYKIVYKYEENRIEILTIHGSRLLRI